MYTLVRPGPRALSLHPSHFLYYPPVSPVQRRLQSSLSIDLVEQVTPLLSPQISRERSSMRLRQFPSWINLFFSCKLRPPPSRSRRLLGRGLPPYFLVCRRDTAPLLFLTSQDDSLAPRRNFDPHLVMGRNTFSLFRTRISFLSTPLVPCSAIPPTSLR